MLSNPFNCAVSSSTKFMKSTLSSKKKRDRAERRVVVKDEGREPERRSKRDKSPLQDSFNSER